MGSALSKLASFGASRSTIDDASAVPLGATAPSVDGVDAAAVAVEGGLTRAPDPEPRPLKRSRASGTAHRRETKKAGRLRYHLSRLPIECLTLVLKDVHPETLLAFSRSCRDFRNLLMHRTDSAVEIWTSSLESHFGPLPSLPTWCLPTLAQLVVEPVCHVRLCAD